MKNKKQQAGFSLLELAIVLTIVAIVVAGGLTLGTAKVQQDQLEATYDEMKEIETALRVFLNEYGRLPCPASITLTNTNALYGREATDCADATPPTGLTRVEYPAASGKYVRIGGVPFYSLGLPDRYLADYYGNRYLYAVQETAITSLTSSSTGNMQVVDNAGTAINSAVVEVIVSHGRSHKGAYSARAGTLYSACDATNKDKENCNADGVFTDAVFNDGSTAANFYDDLILWNARSTLFGSVSGGSTSTSTSSSSSSSTSSGSSYQRVYKLEYKGITPAYAANLGLSYYDTQCNTLYSGSWVLRSSDLVQIETLPAVDARLHIDACSPAEYSGNQFGVIEPTLPAMANFNGTYRNAYTQWNCVNWTSTSNTLMAHHFAKTSSAATPIRFSGGGAAGIGAGGATAATTGIVRQLAATLCNTSASYICVGYKAGYGP